MTPGNIERCLFSWRKAVERCFGPTINIEVTTDQTTITDPEGGCPMRIFHWYDLYHEGETAQEFGEERPFCIKRIVMMDWEGFEVKTFDGDGHIDFRNADYNAAARFFRDAFVAG